MAGLTWDQALGWRQHRHLLGSDQATSAPEVVDRVLALRAWPTPLARGSIAVRMGTPAPASLEDSLRSGDLVRSYAWRGGSYLLTPRVAVHVLAARAASRVWTTKRFQAQGHFELDDWEPFRQTLLEYLADGPRTREEISTHLAGQPGFKDLSTAATGQGADALYKPLHWWGAIAFGPDHDGHATFRLLEGELPQMPDASAALRWLVLRYLGVYGPAGRGHLHYWLTEGSASPSG